MRTVPGRRTRATIVVLAAAGAALGVGASHGSDWPRWRGPEANGVSRETEWNPQTLARPRVRWRAGVGAGHACVSVAGERLYTAGNAGGRDIISCLDAKTGKEIWRHAYPCPPGNFGGPRATPAVEDGLVYTLGRQGQALCLDARTGAVLWQRDLIKEHRAQQLDYGLCGSPLVVGDAVIYNARAGGIALHRRTGEKLWAGPEGPGGYATPVLVKSGDREGVAIFSARELVVVDARGGERLWSFPWTTPFDANAADPVPIDGKVLITSGWEQGCALLEPSGAGARPVWRNQSLRGQFASPIHLDGFVYGIDDNTPNGQLRCVDARTGEIKWTQKGGFENLVVSGGRILAIDRRGVLTVAQAGSAGYRELGRAQVLGSGARNWTAPVIANGLLYCRNGDGELVCVDAR